MVEKVQINQWTLVTVIPENPIPILKSCSPFAYFEFQVLKYFNWDIFGQFFSVNALVVNYAICAFEFMPELCANVHVKLIMNQIAKH